VQQAYRILSNTKTRREYDQWLLGEGLPPRQPRLGPDRGTQALSVVSSPPRAGETPVESPPPLAGELFEDKGPLFGAALRKMRRSRNRSLEELSGELRIPRRYLEAIEADDYDQLPPEVYVRGFVRAYSRALELDERAWVEGYLAGYRRWRGEGEAHDR
ncbi:MAG: helix-turn-helix domain-containing protein, partial [Proteobacteria bacterium]|nr:helix-turn-helix domain-containing protein [Pseudomonadota bacterium]